MGSPPRPFKPLAGINETRLLHLRPATGPKDILIGRLEHIDLDDDHTYEALSYEWGSLQKTHKFTLDNGRRISITESLHHALRDIRYQLPYQGERIIWADAICINQDDIAEREQQVLLMGSIYRKAQQVITYIGPESHDSVVGVQFASQLFENVSFSGGSDHAWPTEDDPRWAAVRGLILRSWASRSWCAQEYLLNANVKLRCGRTDLPDEFLIANVVQLAVERCIPVFCLPEPQDDPNSMRECHRMLADLRLETAQNANIPLLVLLQLCHPLQATDPHDKVYSLLGLAEIPFKVDYACPVEDLYVQVAKSIIREAPTLDILYDNLTHKNFKLPSWVPDWSMWLFGSHGMAISEGYSASGCTETRLELHDAKDALEVEGSLIDRISWLSEDIGPYYGGRFGTANVKLKTWLNKLQKTMQGQALRLSSLDDTLDDILWRSLTGNITFDEEPASAFYKSYFYAHMSCTEESPEVIQNMGIEFHDAVRRRSRYRKLCATKRGFFGAVPETADIGDWICIFNGGKHIFVVREWQKAFKYVGYAYIDGLMQGEGFELGHEGRGLLLV